MGKFVVMIISLIMTDLTVGQSTTSNSLNSTSSTSGPQSILLLGGAEFSGSSGIISNSVELVNVGAGPPSVSTCAAVPPLPTRVMQHSTTIINNNSILSCGGWDGGWTDECWVTSGTGWSEAPKLPRKVTYGEIVAVNGSAYYMGGWAEHGDHSNDILTIGVDLTDTWQLAGRLQKGRFRHCSVLVGGDTIITTGGAAGNNFNLLASVEAFHVGDGTTTRLRDLNDARQLHGCTTYNRGGGAVEVIVVGGNWPTSVEKMTRAWTTVFGVEFWGYSGWSRVGSLPAPRENFPVVNLGNLIYILGGDPLEAVGTSVLASSDGGRTWEEFDDVLQTPGRKGHTAVVAGEIC